MSANNADGNGNDRLQDAVGHIDVDVHICQGMNRSTGMKGSLNVDVRLARLGGNGVEFERAVLIENFKSRNKIVVQVQLRRKINRFLCDELRFIPDIDVNFLSLAVQAQRHAFCSDLAGQRLIVKTRLNANARVDLYDGLVLGIGLQKNVASADCAGHVDHVAVDRHVEVRRSDLLNRNQLVALRSNENIGKKQILVHGNDQIIGCIELNGSLVIASDFYYIIRKRFGSDSLAGIGDILHADAALVDKRVGICVHIARDDGIRTRITKLIVNVGIAVLDGQVSHGLDGKFHSIGNHVRSNAVDSILQTAGQVQTIKTSVALRGNSSDSTRSKHNAVVNGNHVVSIAAIKLYGSLRPKAAIILYDREHVIAGSLYQRIRIGGITLTRNVHSVAARTCVDGYVVCVGIDKHLHLRHPGNGNVFSAARGIRNQNIRTLNRFGFKSRAVGNLNVDNVIAVTGINRHLDGVDIGGRNCAVGQLLAQLLEFADIVINDLLQSILILCHAVRENLLRDFCANALIAQVIGRAQRRVHLNNRKHLGRNIGTPRHFHVNHVVTLASFDGNGFLHVLGFDAKVVVLLRTLHGYAVRVVNVDLAASSHVQTRKHNVQFHVLGVNIHIAFQLNIARSIRIKCNVSRLVISNGVFGNNANAELIVFLRLPAQSQNIQNQALDGRIRGTVQIDAVFVGALRHDNRRSTIGRILLTIVEALYIRQCSLESLLDRAALICIIIIDDIFTNFQNVRRAFGNGIRFILNILSAGHILSGVAALNTALFRSARLRNIQRRNSGSRVRRRKNRLSANRVFEGCIRVFTQSLAFHRGGFRRSSLYWGRFCRSRFRRRSFLRSRFGQNGLSGFRLSIAFRRSRFLRSRFGQNGLSGFAIHLSIAFRRSRFRRRSFLRGRFGQNGLSGFRLSIAFRRSRFRRHGFIRSRFGQNGLSGFAIHLSIAFRRSRFRRRSFLRGRFGQNGLSGFRLSIAFRRSRFRRHGFIGSRFSQNGLGGFAIRLNIAFRRSRFGQNRLGGFRLIIAFRRSRFGQNGLSSFAIRLNIALRRCRFRRRGSGLNGLGSLVAYLSVIFRRLDSRHGLRGRFAAHLGLHSRSRYGGFVARLCIAFHRLSSRHGLRSRNRLSDFGAHTFLRRRDL